MTTENQLPARISVLATGGTIAGHAGGPVRHDYRPGEIGVDALLARVGELDIPARLTGTQIVNIGSEDIGPDVWRALYQATTQAFDDPECDGVIITHGTDSMEETAFLLDLTLPTHKPVVLVGAMRPADSVGYDGLRNLANAIRVASAPDAAGRGVLVVMGDRVFAARDIRKARTRGLDAFEGFPRASVAVVTPSALEWFGAPWRVGEGARLALPSAWPDVPVLFIHAGMTPDQAERAFAPDTNGLVIAGLGEGNMPDPVRGVLRNAAARGVAVVRASRLDEGLVDREPEDTANGFIAARALGPAKARVLLSVLLANGVSEPGEVQRWFDGR
ncbi:MAG: asparaginase [Pseudomonadota bacterium]